MTKTPKSKSTASKSSAGGETRKTGSAADDKTKKAGTGTETGAAEKDAPAGSSKGETAAASGAETKTGAAGKPWSAAADEKAGAGRPGGSDEGGAAAPPAPAKTDGRPVGGGLVTGLVTTVVTLVLVAAIAAAGVVTWPQWGHLVEPYAGTTEPPADPRVAGLIDRLDALEASIARQALDGNADALADLEARHEAFRRDLEAVIGRIDTVEENLTNVRRMAEAVTAGDVAGDARESVQALTDRLSELEQNDAEIAAALDDLRAEQAGKADAEAVDALDQAVRSAEQRIAALEDVTGPAATVETSRSQALVLAINQLRAAVRTGEPYRAEIDSLAALLGDGAGGAPDAAVSALARHADSGVATFADLKERFPGLALAIVRAGRGGDAADGGGWLDETLDRLRSIVTVRRVGEEAEPGSVDAVVATAERHLAAGDLGSAVNALDGLSGKARAAAEPWLADARARLDVARALTDLEVRAISALAPATKD